MFKSMSSEEKKIWVEFNQNCEKNKIPKPSENHFEILLKHSGWDIKKTQKKWFDQAKIFNSTF
ncbi:MAG: hypothetical protein CMO50_08900 [Verrucomicrobiales bacterium]|jgi:hypothetical protein|nr:hypothetical protein [Verrucomicrobiales bacterium]|tara:strand:- start:11 stop:199 length:189 start_codon:yes stop_codon:yes gene_type:complete